MKVYTRTGDKGETSLYSGDRVAKNSPSIEAIGDLDELNANLGLVLSFIPDLSDLYPLKKQLIWIQHALFDAGAAVATPHTAKSEVKKQKTTFDSQAVSSLETWIDQLTEPLKPLTAFILPGGHPCASFLHQARTTCRRAERRVLCLIESEPQVKDVLTYLNRLSDYLFTASRYVNHFTKTQEPLWEIHKHAPE